MAIAVHLLVWDPQRKELFADDWVEIGQGALFFVFLLIGPALLIAAVVDAFT